MHQTLLVESNFGAISNWKFTVFNHEKEITNSVHTVIFNSFSFLLEQQGDISQAEKCADQAVIADRYNAGGNNWPQSSLWLYTITLNVSKYQYYAC